MTIVSHDLEAPSLGFQACACVRKSCSSAVLRTAELLNAARPRGTQPWLSSLRLRTQGTRRLPFKPMPGTSGPLASLTGRRLSSGWRQAELQYAAKPRGSYFRASCFVGCAAVLLRLEAGVKPWHAVRSFLKRVSRHGPTRVHHGAGFALWLRPESTTVPVSRYGSDPNSSAAPFNFCVCGAASCITGLFLQAGESAPYTSRLFLRAAVHFARFLARAQFRARKTGKCTSNRPPNAFFGVHFGCFTAGRRALRLISCTSSH